MSPRLVPALVCLALAGSPAPATLASPSAATAAFDTREPAAPAVAAVRLERLPPVMLWAWERPERLGWLDARACGVAWLAATVRLSGADVVVRPRLQPLRVPAGTVTLAVARLESGARRAPALDAAARARLAGSLAALATRPGCAGLQLDYDAPRSQRPFYRALLAEVREALPDTLALSMTALASWGLGDAWLNGLPVDEIVPMTFRMGADARRVRLHLARGGDFAPARARAAIGCATDEPFPPQAATRRLYLFHPRSWTTVALREALARAGRSETATHVPE